MVPLSSSIWGCTTPVLAEVMAMAWDAMREAHGVGLEAVGRDWCNLWSTKREYWSNPVGQGTDDQVGISSGNGS